MNKMKYRGRIAPTPSGWLHLGHACTFSVAAHRARQAGGVLVYRTEDIDPSRCRPEYADAAMEDLSWWGLSWDEGPDKGGSHGPYTQSERMDGYRNAFEKLRQAGHVYPSPHSRKEIREAGPAQSPIDGDILFPSVLRQPDDASLSLESEDLNWRFRVPDGREISFTDGRTGRHSYVAGQDFGDFVVWKKDRYPAYELAVVVDDEAMKISEVVRGEDLLLATARQILLYEALGLMPPDWFHCPLVKDPKTQNRMSKTRQSLALRKIREQGLEPGKPADYYFTRINSG